MTEFIIVFRETLEASLIVGIIYTILVQKHLASSIQKLWLGVGTSILASIFMALIVLNLSSLVGNNAYQSLFEGIFLYITAGFIYYVIFWLSSHVSDKKQLEMETLNASKTSSWGVFFLVFFVILREGFETVIFLYSSFSIQGTFSYVGFGLGAFFAILIGYFIFVQGRKINLKKFFNITTLCLVFIASGMVAYGSHEIEEYLTQTAIIQEDTIKRPWDILSPTRDYEPLGLEFLYHYDSKKEYYIHILHDKGRVGVFLKGFLGYNSNPNYFELILWFISLLFGLNFWNYLYQKKTNSGIS
ncbi:MAG: iron permease FTR1 family protein [Rickettsiales bacterium]|nr:iron permease FTR1 family protein [Rickettsiales bacterium]